MTIKGQIKVVYESKPNKCTPQVGDIGEVCLVGHMLTLYAVANIINW